MTYPPDPQQPEQQGGYPQQPDPQGGYPQQQPEQPGAYYQQPGQAAYQHPQDNTGQYPPAGVYPQQPVGGSGKNFFTSLFDFSFRSFVTPQVIQIYYIVGLVVLGIGVLLGLISAIITIAEFDALIGLVQLILVPIMGFVYLLALRMGLELVANFFRMGEDVKAMREKADRTP